MLDSRNFGDDPVFALDAKNAEALRRKCFGFQSPYAFSFRHFREWGGHCQVKDSAWQTDHIGRQLSRVHGKGRHISRQALPNRRTNDPGLRHTTGQIHR
ncbi:hypothetical protein D3C86_1903950 [compost metagenome]